MLLDDGRDDDGQDDDRNDLPDEPLEPSLLAAAREYHRPPEPPREAMWRAIQAERRVERAVRPARRRWVAWAAAAAAVLAVGVGIGRMTRTDLPTGSGTTSWGPPGAYPRVNETAYRMATVEHLGQSEAFLTLFRASVQSAGQDEKLARLGMHKTGLGCLYIKRLADVDEGVLEELIVASVDHVRRSE